MSCMSPDAPAGESAFGLDEDSARITACTRAPSTPLLRLARSMMPEYFAASASGSGTAGRINVQWSRPGAILATRPCSSCGAPAHDNAAATIHWVAPMETSLYAPVQQ